MEVGDNAIVGVPVQVLVWLKILKAASPEGLNPPVRVAESLTRLFATIVVAERVVVIVGVALMTVRGSHGLVAGLLFVSPLYVAFQLNWPGVGNVSEGEFGTIPFVTGTGVNEVWMVPVQVLVAFQSS
jgi:hypothetical protein